MRAAQCSGKIITGRGSCQTDKYPSKCFISIFIELDREVSKEKTHSYLYVFFLKRLSHLCRIVIIFNHHNNREWYAGFLQDCPSGKLTPQTFIDMYKMFFPSGDAEKFCQNVFRTFDADKSGTIDFKEFLMAIDVTSAGTPREKLLWAFRSVEKHLLDEVSSF